MLNIQAVRDTYTAKHVMYDKDEGWVISRKTRKWSAMATPMDEAGDVWDVWIQASSQRQLSALIMRLPARRWNALDCEVWCRVDVLTLFDILDGLGFTKRRRLTGKEKLLALKRLRGG
jgi:hypothetical protein